MICASTFVSYTKATFILQAQVAQIPFFGSYVTPISLFHNSVNSTNHMEFELSFLVLSETHV